MGSDIPLLIQRFEGFGEQTLVLAHVAVLRNPGGATSPAEIRQTFLNLRLSPPSNVSAYLAALADQDLLMQPSRGAWAVTPLGIERIRGMMEGVSDQELKALGQRAGEPSFGEVPHPLIPAEFAPAPFQAGIGRFLEGHPFDRNVLCMTRFPRTKADPIGPAIEVCRSACEEVSLELHLASDRTVEDILFGNVAAAMWASRFGIAIFEDRARKGINYNVVLEVGAMLVTGRRCLLLKDSSVKRLPTDLVGHIYQSIDLEDVNGIASAVAGWGKSDLGLS